jgi:hypothetical protein
MKHSVRRHGGSGTVMIGMLAMGLALGGCTQQPDYEPAAADRLQAEVLELSTAAASGDHAAALTSLAELDADARDALARKQISAERYDSIAAAASLVRADLEAAIAAAVPVEPVDSGDSDEDDSKDSEDSEDSDDSDDSDEQPGKGNKGQKGPKKPKD